MNVAFARSALAVLCNSERRLAERWGPAAGRTVARRLLELVAVDAAALDRLPRASVSTNGKGETVIEFGDEVVVRGVITASDGAAPERILITGVDVHGGER